LRPKVLLGFDDADAEKSGPDSVCHHTCSQWIFSRHQPFGNAQAIGRRIRWEISELGEYRAGNRGAMLQEVATHMNVGLALLFRSEFPHNRHLHNCRLCLLQSAACCLQLPARFAGSRKLMVGEEPFQISFWLQRGRQPLWIMRAGR
jgi:hypothetical protein